MPLTLRPIERMLIQAGIMPSPALDVAKSMFQASAVLTAGDIKLFDHLKDGPHTIGELGGTTGFSSYGLLRLLTSMMNLGYVQRKKSHYSLTKPVLRSFPIDLFHEFVLFFRAVNDKLSHSTVAARDTPAGGIRGWDMVKSGEVGKSYQMFMRWLASSMVNEVASLIKLPNSARRMLDIGGSHGLYCVTMCRKYPALRATVLDWPIGLDNAKITMAREKDVAQQIDLHDSDFEKDDLPSGYDFVFLGNIIHGISEEGNRLLFKKIADATASNATIAILDQYSNAEGSPIVSGDASLVGWNLFLFDGEQAYDFDTVKTWLETYGFSSAKLTHLKRSPGFSVITARKK